MSVYCKCLLQVSVARFILFFFKLPKLKEEQNAFCSFLSFRAPNPLFYRCKFLPRLNRDLFFAFSGKTRVKMKVPSRSPGPRPDWWLHALCVFLCIPSLMLNENPIRSETSVREIKKN